ncbi:SRPBCC family protein [Micromonospora sp. NPDC050495]|uniref:SRPBCC family protein n=1 Tax=Micromonospora sp. NPDC050495 TaxID=3154936 RepID=UPI0033C54593
MNRHAARVVGGAALIAAVAAAAYPVPVRRWIRFWGATNMEIVGEMPGDELIEGPDLETTRAVTVAAPPAAVWPWLVQMGSGRGGAYTYDWIENLLGLDMHSADTILPQFQDLKVGDGLPVGVGGPVLRCALLEPERALAFLSDDHRWLWSFRLTPERDGGTRLVSRNRIVTAKPSLLRTAFDRTVMEPGSWVMERRMLLGIKARAEKLAAQQPTPGESAGVPG